MRGTKCRRIVSLLVVLCMAVSLLPMTVTADDTEPTYEYVGAKLDKEYDGTAVSVDVTKDIAVDGKTGVLTAENASVGWGSWNYAPYEVGSHTMELYVKDESGYSSTVLTVNFVIWEKGHTHTFGDWSENNDGETHSRICIGDDNEDGCGYRETEPHDDSEWIINDNGHTKHCDTCDSDYASGGHSYTIINYDETNHWAECDVCGNKIRETAHNYTYTANNDGKTHTVSCGGCDYETTEPHNFGEWHAATSMSTQIRECSDCGFSETRDAKYTVTYAYVDADPEQEMTIYKTVEQDYGTPLDLKVTADKNGWEFVGWSRQSYDQILTEADNAKVDGNITLYAIFKKTQNVRFYSKNGSIQEVIPVEVYNGSMLAFIPKEILSKEKYKDGFLPDEYKVYKGTDEDGEAIYDYYDTVGWTDGTNAEAETIGDLKDGIIPDVSKDYYAIYMRLISLDYDTGKYDVMLGDEREQYFNSAGNYSDCEFVLDEIPNATDFEYWAIGDKEKGEKHKVGNKIVLKDNTTAYAVFTEDLQNITKYKITYDYTTNGGTSMTNPNAPKEISEGEILYTANLGDGVKSGYDFAGWNTDRNAKDGLEYIKADGDITLYAIYKKDITAKASEVSITATLYNNAVSAVITLPEPPAESGWEANGWRDDSGAEYKSGAVRISGNTTFNPSYKKVVTLVYDTNGSSDSIAEQSAVVYKNGSQTTSAAFTLANAPVRNGYEFTSWAVSSDPTRGFDAGEKVTIKESAVATAQWNKIELPSEKMTVTYDYKTNGGTNISATAPFASVEKGARADLAFKSTKDGWDFVGWNTDKDAHTALEDYTVNENVTLYAIFKKDVMASFYSGENPQAFNPVNVTAQIWNNEITAAVTAPSDAVVVEGWTFDGWRGDKYTIGAEYLPDESVIIFDNTDFYAVYKRSITASGENLTQYRNTGGGIESKTIVLDEPETTYNETTNERFAGWEVTVTDEDGNETTTVYDAGAPITVSGAATVKAKTVKIPEGATLPTVETLSASVSSETAATLSKTVTGDNVSGNEIIKQGFVYWSKLSGGTKYTVITDGDTADLSSLSPGTEYYYYAFAENAAGIGKGTIKKFTTESDTVPNAIMISPEYVSVEKGGIYQLLATLLPDTAKNSGIVWSSNNEKIVTVDQNGKVTGVSAGQAVITATTEVGRLTAECIVDVTETADLTPMNFSEWHMASHTSKYAESGNGFDWDTADADGGNHQIATAYLARWEGAVDEKNDQYPDYDGNVASHYKTVNEDYHVQNVEWLPRRTSSTDNDEIKSALMKYGAVYSLMCVDWDCFDDEDGYNYYCPNEINYGGHAITIVGWDDNYSKTKFKSTPAGNGAFICKNSWGDGWGDDGYFYVSYYDAQLGRMDSSAVVTGIETDTDYNTIYQYDPLGAIGYIGFAETTYAANVFPEKGNALTKDETLHAVSFYTYQKNTSYDVYIITNYEDSSSLKKLHNPSASGVIENAGYHTVNLKTPVTLKKDTRFAVVVRFDTPGEDAYVYCEYPVDGYSSNAKANADESYYSYNGKYWDDLTDDIDNANFCIKAFTDNGSVRLSSAIDNSERSYANDKVYTLSEAVDMGMPISDEYIDYIEDKENSGSTIKLMSEETDRPKALGSTPSIVKAGANSVTFTDGSLFPSIYDLRDMGILSPVRDQGEWGTCWAHSMYASLESNILRKQKTTSSETDEAFTLSRTGLTMSQGSAVTLAKRIKPADLTDKSVVWLSSNEDAATVDTNGTVRAIGSGTATISAALKKGGLVAQCSVVVENDGDIEETIEFEEKRLQKEIDDVFMVAYSVTPAKADSIYTWISDNTNVATVNENGVITTKANGTAEISIMSDGTIKDTVTIVVGDGFNIETADIDATGLTLENGVLSGTVSVNINNNASSAKPSSVILAVYDNETNTMAGVVSVPKLLTSSENTIEFNDISFDGITQGGYTLKCFAWNSFGNISPLSRTSEKSITVE